MMTVAYATLVTYERRPADDATPYRVYVVYDREHIYYVGQSQHPRIRLREHISEKTPLGLLLRAARQTKWDGWQVTLFTLEECEPYILWRPDGCLDDPVKIAEAALIVTFWPIMNRSLPIDWNPRMPPDRFDSFAVNNKTIEQNSDTALAAFHLTVRLTAIESDIVRQVLGEYPAEQLVRLCVNALLNRPDETIIRAPRY